MHVAWCPNGGARHLMHNGLIKTPRGIIEESGVPKAAIGPKIEDLKIRDRRFKIEDSGKDNPQFPRIFSVVVLGSLPNALVLCFPTYTVLLRYV